MSRVSSFACAKGASAEVASKGVISDADIVGLVILMDFVINAQRRKCTGPSS